MDITLTINGYDCSPKLGTYKVTPKITYSKVITTLDNVEHFTTGYLRDIIEFTMWPLSDEEVAAFYAALEPLRVSVTYTDPKTGQDKTRDMRVTSGLDYTFGMRSINGKRYYKGGKIQLRQV